jgi:hypothetical protein
VSTTTIIINVLVFIMNFNPQQSNVLKANNKSDDLLVLIGILLENVPFLWKIIIFRFIEGVGNFGFHEC